MLKNVHAFIKWIPYLNYTLKYSKRILENLKILSMGLSQCERAYIRDSKYFYLKSKIKGHIIHQLGSSANSAWIGLVNSMAFDLGFQIKCVLNLWCMPSYPTKVLLKVFQFRLKPSQHTVEHIYDKFPTFIQISDCCVTNVEIKGVVHKPKARQKHQS